MKGTENPADVFTKHLPGNGCIEALLKLFGCHVEGGRPTAAPALRKAVGQSAGEQLQCVQVACSRGLEADAEALADGARDLCQIGEHSFPAVWWEGGWVPEAKSYEMKVLPHQLAQRMDSTFPRAKVVGQAPPQDFDSLQSELEREGERLGKQRLPQSAPR